MRIGTGALLCAALAPQWVSAAAAATRRGNLNQGDYQQSSSSNDSSSASPVSSHSLDTSSDSPPSFASSGTTSAVSSLAPSSLTSLEQSSDVSPDSAAFKGSESAISGTRVFVGSRPLESLTYRLPPSNPPKPSPKPSPLIGTELVSSTTSNVAGSPDSLPAHSRVFRTRTPLTAQTPGNEYTNTSSWHETQAPPEPTSLSELSISRAHGNSSQILTGESQPVPSNSAVPSSNSTIFVTIQCAASEGSNCTVSTMLSGLGIDSPLATPTEPCTSIPEDRPLTSFSIVYTSTVTFYGNRSDYTPPFKPISTPNYCQITPVPVAAPGFAPPDFAPPSLPADAPAEKITATAPRKVQNRIFFRPHLTFVTTDKNPSVAFPSDPIPNYSPTAAVNGGNQVSGNHQPAQGGGGNGDSGVDQHMTAANNGDQGTDNHQKPNDQGNTGGYGQLSGPGSPGVNSHGNGDHRPAVAGGGGLQGGADVPDAAAHAIPRPDAGGKNQGGPRSSFRITARGDQVTINEKTFSDLQPDATSVVTASGAHFTILPTAVVGEGATIQKPAPVGTIISVAKPTTAIVGGLPVTITGSIAVVGGTTLTMPQEGTTAVIQGQRVAITPGAIVVGKQTMSFQPVMPSREQEMLVKGGEMLTAVGKSVVVIHSTTFTYGSGIAGTTKVVDGDTISIGPSGVLVHGTLLGGSLANATDTRLEVVGGATITGMAPSIAIINGMTFTVGPGTHWKTTIIGGETFTIGPTGVVMSTMTLRYPFGQAVTAVVTATDTEPPTSQVRETAAASDKDDGAGCLTGPSVTLALTALCIAIGVHFWI